MKSLIKELLEGKAFKNAQGNLMPEDSAKWKSSKSKTWLAKQKGASPLKDRSLGGPILDLSRLGLKTLKKINFPDTKYTKVLLSDNLLTNLKNCPPGFEHDFSFNTLRSLEGCPKEIHRIDLGENPELASLEGLPDHIDGALMAQRCRLSTLKGGPSTVAGAYSVYDNQLTSLEGAPKTIGIDYSGDFDVSRNPLTSLNGAPDEVQGGVYCTSTNVTSLEGIGQKFLRSIYGELIIDAGQIKSHALGLLLVKGLRKILCANEAKIAWLGIVNKWLAKAHNDDFHSAKDHLIDCQHELIDAGFDDLAKL